MIWTWCEAPEKYGSQDSPGVSEMAQAKKKTGKTSSKKKTPAKTKTAPKKKAPVKKKTIPKKKTPIKKKPAPEKEAPPKKKVVA